MIGRGHKGRTDARSKYGAVATEVDGVRFHSKKEARRYAELRLLQKAGEIRNLTLQPRFELRAALTLKEISRERDPALIGEYRGDFQYEQLLHRMIPAGVSVGFRSDWVTVVEDVKGFKTPLYRWKKKHVEAQYGIRIIEV